MPEIVAWQREQAETLVERAVESIRAGKLVVFPTDTVYKIAAGLAPDAIEQLGRWSESGSWSLAVSGETPALDWAPHLGTLGRRLARRCWPGPVTLSIVADSQNGALARLPEVVRSLVAADDALRLRCPDHDCLLEVLYRLQGPVLLADAGNPAVTAQQIAERTGDAAALIIDDGPAQSDRDATVVQLTDCSWQVLHEGVVSASELACFTPCHILFVCTGNTCRSPMAQALCTRLLAEQLGCPPHELAERGFIVHSAGLSAMMGREASEHAVAVAQEHGADLSEHRSKPLTLELLRAADHLFLMTQAHLQALSDLPTQVGPQPRLLSDDGADVVDPFGGDIDEYRLCARQIDSYLQKLMPTLVKSGEP